MKAGLLLRLAMTLLAVALLVVTVIAVDIWRYADQRSDGPADAALVLGAAVIGDRPSPVLQERLRHAADLLADGAVQRIVVTGGRSSEDQLSEAEASRRWLIGNGVAESRIVVEDRSRTTVENIDLALPILVTAGIGSVLIVTDPLHERRAMLIAARRGLDAAPAPTPTTRYRSLNTQLPFLARETWFLVPFLLLGR